MQSTNPLFTDADKDGMPDSWETANGLNTSADDRHSDGVTNIEEYFAGTADTTHLAAATALSAISTSARVTLSWTAGTSGVAGYNVYRNGVKLNSSLVTSSTYTEHGEPAHHRQLHRPYGRSGRQCFHRRIGLRDHFSHRSFEVFTPIL